MRASKISLGLAAVAAAAFFSGCKPPTGKIARTEALYLAGSQWGDPSTFNPLAESWQPAWPVNDRFNLMYETMVSYNSLTGKVEPGLGTLVSRSNDSVVVDLNPAAKWSDGKPVTSTDVKFVFDLGRRFKEAASGYAVEFIAEIKVASVDNGGIKTERLTFIVDKKQRNNPLAILDLLQAIRIAPSHVFEPLIASAGNKLDSVKKMKIDSAPVVSGPYNLKSYSSEKIVLERRDDYWGNKALHNGEMPAPKYIIHPIFKSNDAFAIGLQQGTIDASMTFIPLIGDQKQFKVGTWLEKEPYYLPGAIPMMIFNVTREPMNDKNFRRAFAAAIDHDKIRKLAVSGYSVDMRPGLVMPTVLEGKFFDSAEAAKHSVAPGIESAKKILAEAGYKAVRKPDGTLDYTTDKAGKKLKTLFITSPTGWSDWEAMVRLAVASLREAGIDVREGFVDASQYWPAKSSGKFDLLMDKPAAVITPSLPWSRFDAVMSSRNWQPSETGSMNQNQGRYNQPGVPSYNAKVDSLLNIIPLTTDSVALRNAYVQLNNIFLDDQPAVPLVYLPEQFYQFSEKTWTNWPTEKNAYGPAQLPWVSAGINTLWKLKLAK
ncbi:MAG: ABC transporter substrate-binding protein [Fibrobacterota bacterium]|nr:ABC transporter substrate-binding protein [Fibrobacterota bacterium]QQS04230.1 MAG: ABC transporter substrate-binding protein [Fibrobacterota bacterium]